MRYWAITYLSVMVLAGGSYGAYHQEQQESITVYSVNKKVSDFPEKEDFSTPESAYAVICRVIAGGGGERVWRRISFDYPFSWSSLWEERQYVSPAREKKWLNAEILEVRIYQQAAVVLADISDDPESPEIDLRYVVLADGEWLNRGQDESVGSLAAARARADDNLFRSSVQPVGSGSKGKAVPLGVLIAGLIVLIIFVVIVYDMKSKRQLIPE
ncbi:MAG: hypothetical protein GY869_31595 [Planctomycetes bacterium]|nr:hypothetical protein [Planctomycetota bacterium]